MSELIKDKPYIYRELYAFIDLEQYRLPEDTSNRAIIKRVTDYLITNLNVVGISALKDFPKKKTDSATTCIKMYQYGDEFRSVIKSNEELFKKKSKNKKQKEHK